eukprot:jgi/Chlat1/5236/Chrsp33S05081
MRGLLSSLASSRSLLPVLLLLSALAVATAPVSCAFTEELLLLRPTAKGNAAVIAHLRFTNQRRIDTEQGDELVDSLLFPKAIHQLVQKFAVQELYVSFAQGRWNQRAWGAPPHTAAPAGAQLWARFDPRLNEAQVQEEWRSLTHALSGLLCASLNYLEGSAKTAAPAFAFRPVGIPFAANRSTDDVTQFTNTKYGALAREAVCTENLTPWLKLLPCRDHAGLAKLLAQRERLFAAQYYSQDVIIQRLGPKLVLTQTLTVLLKPVSAEAWSLSSLFGSTLDGACEVASVSSVYVHDSMGDSLVSPAKSLFIGDQGQYYAYALSRGLDIAGNSKSSTPSKLSHTQAQFTIDRYLTGHGNERGGMVIEVHANKRVAANTTSRKCVNIFQMAPWYVRIYLHTLRVLVDSAIVPDSALRALRLQPAKDREKPSILEISLCLPSTTRMVSVVMEFDKAFLRNDEHPPDPNRGFDLPAAVVTVRADEEATNPSHGDEPLGTPLLQMLQNPPELQLFTNSLTFPVATPDFSMPYNVATLSSTVLAILFGSLLNALIYRPVKAAKDGILLCFGLTWRCYKATRQNC